MCLRYCMFHAPVFLQFSTKTCEGCSSSWLPFKFIVPFKIRLAILMFYIWRLKRESEQKPFIPRHKRHERYLLLPGCWLWASTHFLFSEQDQQHPAGVRGSNPRQAAPQHLQEAPDCLYLVPESSSSCWVPAGILNAAVLFSHRGWK